MPSVNVSDSITVGEFEQIFFLKVMLALGDLGPLQATTFTTAAQMGLLRAVVAGSQSLMLGGGSSPLDALGYPTTPGVDGSPKNSLDGSQLAPCLTLYRTGEFGPIRIPCPAGQHTFVIDIKYGPDDGAATRPQVILRGNEIGVQETIITANATFDTWQSYTASIQAHAAGAIEVFLRLRNPRLPGIAGLISTKVYASFDGIRLD